MRKNYLFISCDDCKKKYNAENCFLNGELYGGLHEVNDDKKDWSKYFNKNTILCMPCIENRLKED